FANHRGEHALLDEKTRAGTANVALIEINSGNDSLNRLINRCVFENDVGRFTAKLERQFLFGSGGRVQNSLPDVSRTGEGDFVDVWMLDNRAAGFAGTGYDVDHAV